MAQVRIACLPHGAPQVRCRTEGPEFGSLPRSSAARSASLSAEPEAAVGEGLLEAGSVEGTANAMAVSSGACEGQVEGVSQGEAKKNQLGKKQQEGKHQRGTQQGGRALRGGSRAEPLEGQAAGLKQEASTRELRGLLQPHKGTAGRPQEQSGGAKRKAQPQESSHQQQQAGTAKTRLPKVGKTSVDCSQQDRQQHQQCQQQAEAAAEQAPQQRGLPHFTLLPPRVSQPLPPPAPSQPASQSLSPASQQAPGRCHLTSLAQRFAAMQSSCHSRLTSGKSAIHGLGAFAKTPHRTGDMVVEYAGEQSS